MPQVEKAAIQTNLKLGDVFGDGILERVPEAQRIVPKPLIAGSSAA